MNYLSIKNKEAGIAALPVTVGVMFVVFVIVVAALSIGFSELLVSRRGTEFREGLYASDLGAQEMLIRMTRNPENTPTGTPDGTYDLSSLANTGDTLSVVLATSPDEGTAATDCPEQPISTGDNVRIITSTAEIKAKAAVVKSKVVVKTDSFGKLTLCSWEALE